MKKIVCALFACLFFLGACTAAPPVEQTPVPPPPPPTPAPTPTPVPPCVLCITDDLTAPFFEGIESAAATLHTGWRLAFFDWGSGANLPSLEETSYIGIVAMRTKEETDLDALVQSASKHDLPLVVGDFVGDTPSSYKKLSYMSFPKDLAPGFALDVALAYPPHDTPVRMLALCDEKNSPADDAYRAAIEAGKVFNRGICYTNEDDPAKFLNNMLTAYVPGLLDCIYVESFEAASIALEALEARTDMEVFLVPTGATALQQALYKKHVFPVALGVDMQEAGQVLFNTLEAAIRTGMYTQSAFSMQSLLVE